MADTNRTRLTAAALNNAQQRIGGVQRMIQQGRTQYPTELAHVKAVVVDLGDGAEVELEV